jgi:outer membrane lipoprotein-sorting protein
MDYTRKQIGLTLYLGAIASFAAGVPLWANAAEFTAAEIMQRVDERFDGDSSIAEVSMVLIDRRNRQRVRDLRIYAKDTAEDSKTLSLFETPADIRGTAYLHFDWDDAERDDDSWLYLPSLQRVKRITSGDTADSFLGSDFTYADINGFEIDWYDYAFVSESEMIDGEESWIIEAIPKPAFKERAEEATGYSKMQSWISKESYLQLRSQAWELRGNRIKYFTASDIQLIDEIWTIKRLQVVTSRNGRQEHASVLQINSIEYNVEVDDSLFTTEYMQRGLD